MKKIINSQGESLVEIIIAIGIVTLVITALISAVTVSMANVQYARNKAQATKYAQEAIEWLRSQRDDLSWTQFVSHASSGGTKYCFSSLDFTLPGVCTTQLISGTIFARDVTLSDSVVGQVQATVKVSWKQGITATPPNVTLDTYLTKW